MSILLVGIPLLLLIWVANIITASGKQGGRLLFNLGLFIVSGLTFIGALGLRFLPADVLTNLEAQGLAIGVLNASSVALMGAGLWGMLVSISPVRQGLARIIPGLDADSSVHSLALVGSGFLIANSLISATPEGYAALAESAVSPTIVDVLAQQLLFVLVAFFGVGLFTRRKDQALNERLGLVRPTMSQLFMGVRWMIFFVFLQAVIGALWTLLSPEQAQQLSSLNDTLLGDFDTVWEWFLLAAAAGVGEELLFRGALQPVFGILFTSIVFALSHVQYGFSPATLTVFLLSVVLGVIRKRSNTTVTMFVHAGYNFILGLLALLAVYLQPLSG
ncbi:MAG: CPBP family intramembrane glutamic endopeptidase [Chloroflexota bacterium]